MAMTSRDKKMILVAVALLGLGAAAYFINPFGGDPAPALTDAQLQEMAETAAPDDQNGTMSEPTPLPPPEEIGARRQAVTPGG